MDKPADSDVTADLARFLKVAREELAPGDAARLAARLFGGRKNDYYKMLMDQHDS